MERTTLISLWRRPGEVEVIDGPDRALPEKPARDYNAL